MEMFSANRNFSKKLITDREKKNNSNVNNKNNERAERERARAREGKKCIRAHAMKCKLTKSDKEYGLRLQTMTVTVSAKALWTR